MTKGMQSMPKEIIFVYRGDNSRILYVDHYIRKGIDKGINTEYVIDVFCSAPGAGTRRYDDRDRAHWWQIAERIEENDEVIYIEGRRQE